MAAPLARGAMCEHAAAAAAAASLLHARVVQRLHSAPAAMPSGGDREVTLLDYGAGNVRSVRNAIRKLGYSIKEASGGCEWRCCR